VQRRDFMRLATVAAGWPTLVGPTFAVAQNRIRLVGTLVSLPTDDRLGVTSERVARMKADLERLGWVEGRDIRYEVRSTFGGPEARAKAVNAMVALKPDVITTSSSLETAAMLAVTRTIPIVFGTAADPVGSGLVESLARPGGNATGFTNSHPSMAGKWVQFLKELDPRITRIGMLLNPKGLPRDGRYFTEPIAQAALAFGTTAALLPLGDPGEIDAAIASYAGGGLILPPEPTTVAHRERIIAAAARHRVPAIYSLRYFSDAGGLMSYGSELEVRIGEYVNLILRGAKVADIPVQSPRKYELLINRKAVEALGLTIPLTLLARADQIIE
jgi:putative tryptophan/tyrosine transport system substrate-binding protein